MRNMARLLCQHGWEVQVICCLPNYPTGRIFRGYRRHWHYREVIEEVEVHRLWLYPSNSGKLPVRAFSMSSQAATLRLLGPRLVRQFHPDMLLVSSPPLLMAAAGLRLAKNLSIPAILNVSDLWPESVAALSNIRARKVYSMLENIESRMYQTATAHLAQSNHILQHIRAVAGGKPGFVYRNLQQPSPYAATPRRLPGFRLVYAGLLGIAQGLAGICRAVNFASLGVTLDIYGGGAEEQEVRSILASNPGRGITMHPAVPASQMPELLSQYHAALVPLKVPIPGAVPSKLFMAAAHGIPVLFGGGGEGEVLTVQLGLGQAYPPGNYQALELAILSLKQKSTLDFASLQRHIQQIAATELNAEMQGDGFLNWLAQLLPA